MSLQEEPRARLRLALLEQTGFVTGQQRGRVFGDHGHGMFDELRCRVFERAKEAIRH